MPKKRRPNIGNGHKIIIVLLSLTFISSLVLIKLVFDNSGISTNQKSQPTSNMTIKPYDENDKEKLGSNEVFAYTEEVPLFPKVVEDYELVTQSNKEELQVNPDLWSTPDKDGLSYEVLSCKPYFWIIRWRSQTEQVEVFVSSGIHTEGYVPLGEVKKGGAGMSTGRSCIVPAFKFGRALNGNDSNMTYVNYEYQIWEYSPKI